MESQNTEIQDAQTSNAVYSKPLAHRRRLKLLLALLAVVLIAMGLGGGYWYGHSRKVAAVTPSTSKLTSSQSPTKVSNANKGVHFVESRGYTWPSANYKLVTKLGIPDFMQAIRVSSIIQNSSTGFQMFGNGTFNNELGWWQLGTPTDPQNNGGGISEVSLTDIGSQWLNDTGKNDWSRSSITFNNPLETPSQKQQFMTHLKSSTSACAKDPSKGFKTVDGSLDVCYTYSYGLLPEGYDPRVSVIGYGDIKNQQVVLLGYISIYDPSQSSDSVASLEQLKNNIQKGSIPPQTAQAQKGIIAALKQTTITTSLNQK